MTGRVPEGDRSSKASAVSARTVSAAAVAREAGVSTATVSYVMNGQGGVSEHTRRRVLTLAREMGYRPRSGPRIPDARRNNVVGLVVPNMTNPMFPRWAQGVVDRAAEIGHEVFLASTSDDADVMTSTVQAMIARKVDGLILASIPREEVAALQLLRAARVPYVQLSRRSDFVAADFVGIEDAAAAEAMMHHVIGHGRHRVATVIGPRFSSASAARERGYLATAEALGIRVPPEWRLSTRLNNAGGRLAAQELLAGGSPPDAILCGSDEVAIGVIEYLLKQGLKVPEDVVVTGFDGLPHSRSALVSLTTVVQPQIGMAKAAFDVLQARIDDPAAPYQSLVMPHELWIGRTCGCPPESQSHPDTPTPDLVRQNETTPNHTTQQEPE
ncbi:LacI family DNA-binding transcriptional regulator [Ornithinicoccus hortensis]|uniref:LacI family transcriptional regulator n=1 Tax=Ornithinicoccus hortensis TaxID=82346 RepID=A0A542YWL6_9MICO|nr:LacI family DNA-binding transcriptional regulator [Ornithinicoccus hortensis]TQL52486.1 LacI family transcriptional regulator [Ornithinicoccus hortensis]